MQSFGLRLARRAGCGGSLRAFRRARLKGISSPENIRDQTRQETRLAQTLDQRPDQTKLDQTRDQTTPDHIRLDQKPDQRPNQTETRPDQS